MADGGDVKFTKIRISPRREALISQKTPPGTSSVLYDPKLPDQEEILPAPSSLAFSVDGIALLVGHVNGFLSYWSLENRKCLAVVKDLPETNGLVNAKAAHEKQATKSSYGGPSDAMQHAAGPFQRAIVSAGFLPSSRVSAIIGDSVGTIFLAQFRPIPLSLHVEFKLLMDTKPDIGICLACRPLDRIEELQFNPEHPGLGGRGTVGVLEDIFATSPGKRSSSAASGASSVGSSSSSSARPGGFPRGTARDKAREEEDLSCSDEVDAVAPMLLVTTHALWLITTQPVLQRQQRLPLREFESGSLGPNDPLPDANWVRCRGLSSSTPQTEARGGALFRHFRGKRGGDSSNYSGLCATLLVAFGHTVQIFGVDHRHPADYERPEGEHANAPPPGSWTLCPLRKLMLDRHVLLIQPLSSSTICLLEKRDDVLGGGSLCVSVAQIREKELKSESLL